MFEDIRQVACSPEEARSELLELLLARSFARRTVTLSSGRQSDYYIDCKQTTLHGPAVILIGRLFYERLQRGAPVQAVGGLTLGADPLATAVAMFSSLAGSPLDAFIVRQQPKAHGTQQWLEGHQHLPPGCGVAILEDVTTTGGSALRAIARAQAEGLSVRRVLTLVDRQEGAAEALESQGWALESIFTRADLLGQG